MYLKKCIYFTLITTDMHKFTMEEFENLCKTNPKRAKINIKYTCDDLPYEYLDLAMMYLFNNSIDEYMKFTERTISKFGTIKYFYDKSYDMNFLTNSRIDLYTFSDSEFIEYMDIINSVNIKNSELLYYRIWKYVLEDATELCNIIYKIIDIVGIDKLCSVGEYNEFFYNTAVKYNMSIEQIYEIKLGLGVDTWSAKSLAIIISIANTYGYEYGLKIMSINMD